MQGAELDFNCTWAILKLYITQFSFLKYFLLNSNTMDEPNTFLLEQEKHIRITINSGQSGPLCLEVDVSIYSDHSKCRITAAILEMGKFIEYFLGVLVSCVVTSPPTFIYSVD